MVASEKTSTNPNQDYFIFIYLRACATEQGSEATTSWTNSSERKPDLVEDHDQQHRTTLEIEGKARRIKSRQG